MNDCTPQEQDSARITTSSDVIAGLRKEIDRLERELSQALAAADVEAREADRLRLQMAQREPLTKEFIDVAIQQHVDPVATYRKLHAFARAIEQAHGITAGKGQSNVN